MNAKKSNIVFCITLVASSVKKALEMKAELVKAGEGAEITIAPSLSNAPRSSVNAPSASRTIPGMKGPHELAYLKEFGDNQVTISGKMAAAFGLSGTREQQIAKFTILRRDGKAVRTVSGWRNAESGTAADSAESDNGETSDCEIDIDAVV